MKLTAEHFPISCSLHTAVADQYASQAGQDDAHVMPLDELLGYIRQPHDLDLTPYADLLSQTEEMGDPALPSREHTSLLRWVGEAMHHFEQRFPLEEPLASQVRRLKPLVAATALLDTDFLQPDVHPLHQLLDAIQERAVGWQPTLGRAGAALEQQVATAIDGALAWLEDDGTDLSAVCAKFLAAAERDHSRAERMSKRVVETEMGRVKTAAAKRDAAQMINACLEKHPVPDEISDFLKGPWYDSAQLVLLKFSSDSEQWRKMAETTETLLDSMQSLEDAPEERRQHIFAVVTQLPKEMRRWLLSLHHDTDAVNDAMGIVEFAHLRILRRQPVETRQASLIPTGDGVHAVARPGLVDALKPIEQGQWFGVDVRKQGTTRVQLALKDEQEQRLLFTNLAGMKVLDYSFEDFDKLIDDKGVLALPSGGGFSLCLAIAAGVDTTDKLEALYAALAVTPEPVEEPAPAEEPAQEAGTDDAPADSLDAFMAEAEQDAPDDADADADVAAAGPGDELLDADELEALEALIDDDPLGDLDDNSSYFGAPADDEAVEDLAASVPAQGGQYFGGGEPEPTEPEPAPASPPEPEPAPLEDGFLAQQAQRLADQPEPAEPAAAPTTGGALDLPMGAWLGFHDGDTPLMAKLAVHDPGADVYIFVNRQGIKMRELGGAELAALMSQGLVDILQTTSSFREDVDAARRELDS